jgi:hypothetical protein
MTVTPVVHMYYVVLTGPLQNAQLCILPAKK